jgi:hypothetical protein
MIWLLAHILLTPPPPVIKLSLYLTLSLCRQSSLLTGGEEPIIRPRENLDLYKIKYSLSVNISRITRGTYTRIKDDIKLSTLQRGL